MAGEINWADMSCDSTVVTEGYEALRGHAELVIGMFLHTSLVQSLQKQIELSLVTANGKELLIAPTQANASEPDPRVKFRNWWANLSLPVGSSTGIYQVHRTLVEHRAEKLIVANGVEGQDFQLSLHCGNLTGQETVQLKICTVRLTE